MSNSAHIQNPARYNIPTHSGSGKGEGSGSNDEPIPVGSILDSKYLVNKVLGHGSMGVVYLATDLALEREVAIKVLLPRYAEDEIIAQRFRREAVAMASVRHNNVVQIFAFGDHQGYPYFIMEYIPGHTIANLIESVNNRGEQLYLDVVLGMLSQVCQGLQAVHYRGIVHRDVKPANMLIGPRFRVAITDFGLVEPMGQSPSKRDLAGTPLYLAPELIRREHIPENQLHLCDIYALGISTYEMLSGTVPFDGNNVKEILRSHLQDSPRPISDIRADIPTAFDEVLLRAMCKNPSERYSSCIEFLEALTTARGSENLAPRTTTKRILVVDDDPEMRMIYTTALKVGIPEATVITAEDGLSAMEQIKTSRPDLILLDLEMPRMNGLEVCAALTGDELTAGIPLVLLSAHTEEKTQALLRSIGVRSILHKPVELTHLVDLVQRYTKK